LRSLPDDDDVYLKDASKRPKGPKGPPATRVSLKSTTLSRYAKGKDRHPNPTGWRVPATYARRRLARIVRERVRWSGG